MGTSTNGATRHEIHPRWFGLHLRVVLGLHDGGVFIAVDFNIANWTKDGRAACMIFGLCFAAVAGFLVLNISKEQ